MSPSKIILIIFSFLLFSSSISIGQELPNYLERSFQERFDSVQSSRTEMYVIEATEGSINPEEYFVGPGDKIFISISGIREFVYTVTINHEGWLYIPQVGGVDLNNNTLAEARTEIEKSISKYFRNVKIFISLIDFRKIRVSLIGDVVKPSNFILTANSRLMDIISISAGMNKTASLRNIKIISRTNSVVEYDLLAFLRFGSLDNNPLLREGDVVLVDKSDKTIRISGEIKYPGVYEYVENESVYNLIQLAGGFLSNAKKDTIEVIRFDDKGIYQKSDFYNMVHLENNKVFLRNKDHVVIRGIPEYLIELFVKVDGYVRFPGFYMIEKEKTTLSEIIAEAGGLLDNGSYTEATLTRKLNVSIYDPEFERLRIIPRVDMTDDEYAYFKAKSRERPGRVVVNFYDLLVNKKMDEDVLLYRGDLIEIPEKKNYITLLGQVVNPGNIEYNPDYSVQDYINIAGGFGWRALENDVRVIKAHTGEWVDADEVKSLEPGDTIWIPEDPPSPKFWDVFMDSLQIAAQLAAVIVAVTALIIASK